MSEQLLLDSCFLEEFYPSGKVIRPIHYLGSKLRLSNSILKAIDEVDGSDGRVCDLFSGSGTVTSLLSQFRPVTSVDIQEYSRVLCSAIVKPSSIRIKDIPNILKEINSSSLTEKLLYSFKPLIDYEKYCLEQALCGTPNELAEILENGPLIAFSLKLFEQRSSNYQDASRKTVSRLKETQLLDSAESITSRYFGGIYFSFYQSVYLDSFLGYAKSKRSPNCDTIKSAVLSAASTLVNTVGKQFAQPIKPRSKDGEIKTGFVERVNRDRNIDPVMVFSNHLSMFLSLPKNNFDHQAITGNYIEVLEKIGPSLSCVYADPPYTRDHYSRYYHVLETMCKADNPSIAVVTRNGRKSMSRGVYRIDRHQSPFCIRSEAPSAFKDMFRMIKRFNIPLVLSYSPHEQGDGTHPRVVSMEKILALAKREFKHVDVVEIDNVSHSDLNHRRHRLIKRKNAELLLKCYNN